MFVRSSLLSVSDSELSADAAVAAAAVPTTDPVTCKELIKYIFSIPLPKDLWGPMLAYQKMRIELCINSHSAYFCAIGDDSVSHLGHADLGGSGTHCRERDNYFHRVTLLQLRKGKFLSCELVIKVHLHLYRDKKY